MHETPETLTLKQAADLLQVSERTLHRLLKSGELPGRQVGRQWRFERAQLLAWVRGEDSTEQLLRAQRRTIEQEAGKFGLDVPETLVEMQQAALRRLGRAKDD